MSDRVWMILHAGGYVGPYELAKTDFAASSRLHAGEGPFQRRRNRKNAGEPLKRGAALTALHEALVRGDIGNVFSIHDGKGNEVFRCREVKPAVEVINTSGNDKADKLWSAVKAEFPKCTFLGAYVCKMIVGTSTHSQHSYGNAVDVGAATMAQLHVIADWIVARHDEFDIATVIVDQQVWTPSEHWHTYTGDRHYHVHSDYQPSYSGPCGVRP
jgi:hypothetical protein